MERIKGGYILQPRSFDNSSASHFPPCTREVWFFLLRNVNHADNGKFKRGSGFFALEDIQNALSWSVGCRVERYPKYQLVKAIRRLREGNMVATTKATRGVFITVLNYDKYQDPKQYEGNDEGNTKATRRQHEGTHLKQECKNERRKDKLLSAFPPSKQSVDGVDGPPFYRSKKGKRVEGKTLDAFNRFWAAFDYPKGKAEAADAFLVVYTPESVDAIIEGARVEAMERQMVIANGKTPKMAQGWLSGRRWEDYVQQRPASPSVVLPEFVPPLKN